ncbi:flavin monoamine oxidase family protein [Terricaulis sp.]|uniref:flavin monoamine oxidase family protein n=1 Tax=Terricaulis sp. TaxID=2768686 RepID=UPI002AC798EF|nr:FAD-dependent oxidoreductase [Terricaulis sp.]MDZ4690037.1 FAD-dependent oxidoreductase [Terricaulis sp.]
MRRDVVIVGGGVSGTFCAFEMHRAHPGVDIALFDSAADFGGRTASVDMGAARPLEGGASFVSSAHRLVLRLARELRLPMTEVRFRQVGLHLEADCAPPRGKQGLGDSALTGAALQHATLTKLAPQAVAAIAAADVAAAKRILRSAEMDGRALWRWPIGPLLERLWSPEQVRRARATHGCTSNFGAANAFDTLLTAAWEGAPGQSFYRFDDGAGNFGRTLAKASPGVLRFTHHRLIAIGRCADEFVLSFSTPAGLRHIKAGLVILALPRLALSRIAFGDDSVGAAFHHDLAQILDVPAFKLFLEFDRRWWDDLPFALGAGDLGAVFTQLAAQQNYFENAARRHWMLAVFADSENALYWRSLLEADGAASVTNGAPMGAAPAHLIAAAHRHLEIMYGRVPAPRCGVYADWSAGWHAWRAGARSWEVRERLVQPNSNLPLFICGELLAEHAGWMESALNNAEEMLERASAWLARPRARTFLPFINER